MTIEEIRDTLSKMNLAQVSRDTGLHHNTLLRIKNDKLPKPSSSVLALLTYYFESVLSSRTRQ